MNEYSVEEVRARFEKWVVPATWFKATIGLERSGDEYADPCINSRWQGWKAAYAERIEAVTSAPPVDPSVPTELDEVSLRLIEVTEERDHLRKTLAAQMNKAIEVQQPAEPTAKPVAQVLTRPADCARGCPPNQVCDYCQKAPAPTADPVTQGEAVAFGYVYQSPDEEPVFEYAADRWSAGLRYGSYTETPVYAAQPAQSVDVAKVRRVAADIRHWNEAICHPALNVFADKLETAIKGVA